MSLYTRPIDPESSKDKAHYLYFHEAVTLLREVCLKHPKIAPGFRQFVDQWDNLPETAKSKNFEVSELFYWIPDGEDAQDVHDLFMRCLSDGAVATHAVLTVFGNATGFVTKLNRWPS